MASEKLNIRHLKAFAQANLSGALKEILLEEKDELAPEEFLAKLEIWLRLLDREM
jgi:hypothetical protein